MRIYNFREFIKENYSVNEGLASWTSSFFKKSIEKLTGWAKKLINAIESKEVPLIPAGPKEGTPVMMIYSQEVGPVVDQMSKMFGVSKLMESEVYEERYPQSFKDVPGIKGNVDDVSPSELAEEIKLLYRTKEKGGNPNPIFIYGAPGIGKTGVVGQVCDELGLDLLNIDIQFMSPEDFMGVPTVVQVEEPKFKETIDPETGKVSKTRVSAGTGFTRFNVPTNLPQDNGKRGKGGIVFLDEFNRPQTPSVMNALLNFVQQGRIGPEYQLPPKWFIVAAGNRPGEAEVSEPDPALARRFNIVNLVTEVGDFKNFLFGERSKALAQGKQFRLTLIDELIYFLASGPGGKPQEELLHYLDPEVDPLSFPAPANWTKALEMVYDNVEDAGVASWKELPIETIEKCFRRKVGANAAAKFMTYLKLIKEIDDSDLDKMSMDPLGSPIVKGVEREKSLLFAIMDMAIRRIPDYNPERLANLVEYFDRYKQNEMLAWLYNRIKKMYPDFGNLDDDSSDGAFKEKAALFAKEAALKKLS